MKMIANGKLALAETREVLQMADADATALVPWYRAGGSPVPIAAYQPKGAASLAASYVNLANPGTYDCTAGVAPTLDSNGWNFNGTTMYLQTGLFPAANWSAVVQFSNNLSTAGFAELFGVISTPNYMLIIPHSTTNGIRYGNGAGLTYVLPVTDNGNLAVCGTKAYRNGVDEAITLTAWSGGAAAYQIAIGCANFNGTYTHFIQAKIAAIAFYSSVLTSTQVAALATAMAAL